MCCSPIGGRAPAAAAVVVNVRVIVVVDGGLAGAELRVTLHQSDVIFADTEC
jgi:hypothetical protein